MGHVIVTGGSSGIGYAVADLYAARGEAVSLIARSAAPLETARAQLQQKHAGAGARLHCEAADVGESAAVERAVAACEAALGPCTVLVTSAGIVTPGAFENLPQADFDAQIRTNLLGTANAVRCVYSGMSTRSSGSILMIGSGAALIGIFGYTAYCASKYAVTGFAEALRAEARRSGVRVAVCHPPDTDTPQLAAERALRPPEADAMIEAGGLWSAARVAAAAVAGLERGRFSIRPGLPLTMLGLFGSLAMPVLRPWFDRRIATVARSAAREPAA